jgi:hypothetical protein
MNDIQLIVPTYNRRRFPQQVARGELEEYGAPEVPVLVREADGLRIMLGARDFNDQVPDLLVERQPGAWVVFVHHPGGGDPSCEIYLMDDGRTLVSPEIGRRDFEILSPGVDVPELEASNE